MGKRKREILTTENDLFRVRVREFCDDWNISQRELSDLCGGSAVQFAKSKVGEFMLGKCTNEFINDKRPVIVEALTRYLFARQKTREEITDILQLITAGQEFTNMLANRTNLPIEARKFFGLKADPFDVDTLPFAEDIFSTPALDETAAKVKDAILYKRFVAVIGDVGTGKTLLKLRVAHELDSSQTDVRLLYPEFFDMGEITVANIATQILTELKQPIPRDRATRVRVIRDVLTSYSHDDVRVALVLDECHRLDDRVITSLKNFWEMNDGAFSRLLGVVLFGQPAFIDSRLRDLKFKEIRQRVQIIDIPNLAATAPEYLAHRIKIAGGDIGELFEPTAVKRICEAVSAPLALGNLANEALIESMQLDEKKVLAAHPFIKKLGNSNQVLASRRRAA